MVHPARAFALVALAVLSLVLGCAEAGTPPEVATVSANADLSPAYEAGVDVQNVAVSLAGTGDPIAFDLAIDQTAQTASGSKSDVPLGTYSATVTVSDANGSVGQASNNVEVRADTSISVTIVIDGPSSGGGTVTVDLE